MAWQLDFTYDPNKTPAHEHGHIYATDPATGRQILWRGHGSGYACEPDGEGMAVRGAVTMAGELSAIFVSADRVCERRAAERVS